ncbi:MAG: polysaccharide pyruvyl transferase family protein [Bryobacteraceae bacterium]
MIRAFQISTGLGAGNIGDELMAHAFWRILPPNIRLSVALLPESARQHQAYPEQHEYLPVVYSGNENDSPDCPGLLVGDSPVVESEGLDWPLRFLAGRLECFHRNSMPVDALGVGVDQLHVPEAIRLFHDAFLPIRSWTVRSGVCRDALLELGVEENRIKVGADWAWLHQPQGGLQEWAERTWTALGINPRSRLLVINPVNMIWRDSGVKREFATAFDAVRRTHGFQIAFFCNECRTGDFFDFAAAREIQESMKEPSAIVPAEYYSPDEAIALLGCADVTVAQRYHFAVESILAGTVPVCVIRGQKMTSLTGELGLLCAGTVNSLVSEDLVDVITDALQNRTQWQQRLARLKGEMAARATHNLDLLLALPPYNSAMQPGNRAQRVWRIIKNSFLR